MIFLRFRAPTAGIWKVYIYGAAAVNRRFHIWLPMQQFISEGTYFLRSDPDVTLSDAACADDGISVGAFNNVNNSLYAASGRGFTVDSRIKPDLVAPGVNLSGTGSRWEIRHTDRYKCISGSGSRSSRYVDGMGPFKGQ